MEAKLRKPRVDLLGGLLSEGAPDPLADYAGQTALHGYPTGKVRAELAVKSPERIAVLAP